MDDIVSPDVSGNPPTRKQDRYRAAPSAKVLEQYRRYHNEHRQERNEQSIRYRAAHPERVKETNIAIAARVKAEDAAAG